MEIKPLAMNDQMRMMRGVDSILPKKSAEIGQPIPGQGGGAQGAVSFMDYLEQQVKETNQLGLDSDRRIAATINGEDVNPHETVIALQQADISFRLMLTVKERLIQAYDQLMRTPLG
jgi:flagellar hook-basal body complex protein FliE